MRFGLKCFLFVVLTLTAVCGNAQTYQIQLGPDEVAENQSWTISLNVSNGQLKTYSNFPDIDGFRKRGTSSSSQTSIINGQVNSVQSVIMTYVPTKQGSITVPPFSIKINDQTVNAPGKKVKVGPPAQSQSRDPFGRDPFGDFFGGREETEFVDVKEDAQLMLTTNKDEVYLGEGVTVTLSFLVADNNRAPMQFFDLGKQLSDILKKLKPANCWEENFNIENIDAETIQINGKGYSQYKIYQATFFPLNNDPIKFPSVGLQMIKFKVAKNPSFFGQNRQEDFKTFYSKAKTIKVKSLPMQNAVAVGTYRLEEKISTQHPKTGQSIGYEFNISGEGNISSIEAPLVNKDNNFDFYEPNIQSNISRDGLRVTGTKGFKYFIVPKEPGEYSLGDYFQWVYFDPVKKKYDTLRSQLRVTVDGESQRNQAIQSSDLGSFYDRIGDTDNSLQSKSQTSWIKIAMNALIVVVLAASAYLVISSRSKA